MLATSPLAAAKLSAANLDGTALTVTETIASLAALSRGILSQASHRPRT
jgi:hypothetical protein